MEPKTEPLTGKSIKVGNNSKGALEVTFEFQNSSTDEENKQPIKEKKVKIEKPKYSTSEKRVNKSFIIMLLVFVITYLPACIMTAYMNLCSTCNCTFIHSCRDLTYLFILSSAVFRPLNFILRLKTMRKEIYKLMGFKLQGWTESTSRTETLNNATKYKI